MSYRELLVVLDAAEASNRRLDVAATLAKHHDAHLTALCPALEFSIPAYVAHQVPSDVLERQREQATSAAEQIAQRAYERVNGNGLDVECRVEPCLEVDLADLVDLHARYADLVVMGQDDPDNPSGATPRGLQEQVVLAAGRPVMLVPYIGAGAEIGKKVMVAWDAGRESARAVKDALPLLEAAEAVTILVVNPRKGASRHGALPGADVALYLARHDVKVDVQEVESRELDVAEVILSRISDLGIDLLVMGAYGHARWRELALGGATRKILQQMTVPVLMSH